MRIYVLLPVLALIGLLSGCRYGCTPYDNCGPVFANPHNCKWNYRSGSAFNTEPAPAAVEGVPVDATGTITAEGITTEGVTVEGLPAGSQIISVTDGVAAPGSEMPADIPNGTMVTQPEQIPVPEGIPATGDVPQAPVINEFPANFDPALPE